MKEKRLKALVKKYRQASYNLTDKEIDSWNEACEAFLHNDTLEKKVLSVRFINDMPNTVSICYALGRSNYSDINTIVIGLKSVSENLDADFLFLHELGHFFLFRYPDKLQKKTSKRLPEHIIIEYQADMIADFLGRKYNIKIQTKSKLFNLSIYGFFNLFIKEKNKYFNKNVLSIKKETYKAIKQLFDNPDNVLKQLDKKLKNYKAGKDFYIK